MGDLIGQAVEGQLYYIEKKQFDKIASANIEELSKISFLADMCRLNTLYMIARAGSGHIGSSFSSMDIFSWLFWKELRKDDIFFSSKGHDAPGYYSVLLAQGKLPFDLIHKLRRIDGLPGHPDINTPNIVTNTGSLGMGISKAKGMIFANRLQGKKNRVFVLTGDGELQEGQFWESLVSAVNYGLHELTVIIDHNKLQSDTFVKNVSDLGDLEAKLRAFGWRVERCDGNNMSELSQTLSLIRDEQRPKIIIADTIKGKGVSFMEHTSLDSDVDMYKFHSGAPDKFSYQNAAQEIIARLNTTANNLGIDQLEYECINRPETVVSNDKHQKLIPAYTKALLRSAEKNPHLMALDADLILDTGLIPFKERFPDRFIECGIAEQDMVSIAGGLALKGVLPIVHSFACFLSTRPNEQIYNNATESTKIIYVGSLAGVLPGGPGHSHQAVRDIASLSGIPGLTLIEPCCEQEVEAVVDWAVNENTASTYIRLTSIPYEVPFEYEPYKLEIGKGQILKQGSSDIAILAYGPVMLSEAYKAALLLEEDGISITVIDLPWLNRVDPEWLINTFKNINKLYTIDNHYIEGGQGQFIASQIATHLTEIKVTNLGIVDVPKCGQNGEILETYSLSSLRLSSFIKSMS